jgi:putative phage-type endonuclease
MQTQSYFDQQPKAATADRTKLIGASEAAAILGLSPWSTPFNVWQSKVDPQPDEDSPVLERGRYLEAGLLEWTAAKSGAKSFERGPALKEPGLQGGYSFLSVRPDGALHMADGSVELAEIKTSRDAHEWGATGTDLLPQHYAIQVLLQMAVCPGIERTRVGAYLPIADELRVMVVERDEALIRWIIDKLGEWHHQHIVLGKRPAVDGSEACRAYLRRQFPVQTEPMRVASIDEALLVLDLVQAKASAKAADAEAERLGNLLRAQIGSAEGLIVAGGKVTYRWQAGANRVDTDFLKSVYPEVHAKVCKQGDDQRVLRLAVT